jgi:hypothetical protein
VRVDADAPRERRVVDARTACPTTATGTSVTTRIGSMGFASTIACRFTSRIIS